MDATNEEARLAAEQAALVAKEEAEARAQAKALAAEKAKADAEAKATDTGFDNMIENADQAKNLRKIVEKNAAIEAAAAAKEEATKDYQDKLDKIANAKTVERVNELVTLFINNNSEEHREGLDLASVAESKMQLMMQLESCSLLPMKQNTLQRSPPQLPLLKQQPQLQTKQMCAFKNADKANDLADVLDAAESLDTSGDSSTLTALLKNPGVPQR